MNTIETLLAAGDHAALHRLSERAQLGDVDALHALFTPGVWANRGRPVAFQPLLIQDRLDDERDEPLDRRRALLDEARRLVTENSSDDTGLLDAGNVSGGALACAPPISSL